MDALGLSFLKYIYKSEPKWNMLILICMYLCYHQYDQPLGSPRKVSQVLNPKDLSILTASLVFDGVLIKQGGLPLVHLQLFVDPDSIVYGMEQES